MSREALAAGLEASFSRPDRIRPWTYDFDPSGLELLRRAIEHVASARPVEPRDRAVIARPYDARVMRDFHVRREPRERYAVARPLIGSRGDLVVTDLGGIRRLAARMNTARADGRPVGQAGEIAALGLLHEIGHLLIARYEQLRRPRRDGRRTGRALEPPRTGRGPPARPLRRGVPGSRSRAGAAGAPARGDCC